MKTKTLQSLQSLRVLREQRAATALVAQQQRVRETGSERDQARERLREHRESIAREAEAIYASLEGGLSVASWQAAQARLQDLAEGQEVLEEQVGEVSQKLQVEELHRDACQRERLMRQRQSEAWQSLVERRERVERGTRETREESDLAQPAVGSGS
ncbi:type III secretion system stalk subunit SctO [Pseudomonas gingeri]|uniref:type III secretion system stalk subunit SctO n=1 Tax=Pseudomonas gingeri TaxID=117681 RepID=UPI0015A28DA4|nr:YscO family type III secretion system apparatus protein [Pseudomonas gingeri]NWA11384.1 YscO family type III secretion system apparatus protein [Pseudomonas gingeri]